MIESPWSTSVNALSDRFVQKPIILTISLECQNNIWLRIFAPAGNYLSLTAILSSIVLPGCHRNAAQCFKGCDSTFLFFPISFLSICFVDTSCAKLLSVRSVCREREFALNCEKVKNIDRADVWYNLLFFHHLTTLSASMLCPYFIISAALKNVNYGTVKDMPFLYRYLLKCVY